MIDTDPREFLNQTVTLAGIARNAASGAVVLLSDRTPIYIKGRPAWDKAWDRKQIRIVGILRNQQLAPNSGFHKKGEHLHGMQEDALILEDAKWELV